MQLISPAVILHLNGDKFLHRSGYLLHIAGGERIKLLNCKKKGKAHFIRPSGTFSFREGKWECYFLMTKNYFVNLNPANSPLPSASMIVLGYAGGD